jgi:leucyl-tRNA synthetase
LRRIWPRNCGRAGREGAICARRGRSDPALAKEDELEIPVQINGKLVTVVRVAADADGRKDH